MRAYHMHNAPKGDAPSMSGPTRTAFRRELPHATRGMAPARGGRRLTGRGIFFLTTGFFAIVFAVNAAMLTLALGTFPGVEVESSYRAGLLFNDAVAAAEAQAARRWQIDATLTRHGANDVKVRVAARDAAGAPLTGHAFAVALKRPASDAGDRRAVLREEERGAYAAVLRDVPVGQWILEVEAAGLAHDGENATRAFFSRNRVFLSE